MKAKKVIKLEGKHIVYSACNSGTSALVSKDGQLYMFGKDTLHCDDSTGKPGVPLKETKKSNIRVTFAGVTGESHVMHSLQVM